MTPSFTTPLDLRHGSAGGWGKWTLLSDLVYGSIVVPAGMRTDGASVPRWLWSILAPTGRWMAPAVVHDMGCQMIRLGTPHPLMHKRADADRAFHEAMLSVGTNKITAWLMWAAVRVAGVLGRK